MSALDRTSRQPAAGAAPVAAAATLLFACALTALAFQQAEPAQKTEQAELTSHETEPTFKLKAERNLVVVRVVVRDSKGRPVGTLGKEDFRLLDNGKPQAISHFTVEGPSAAPAKSTAAAPPSGAGSEDSAEAEPGPAAPRRFLAMFFDDIHLQIGDMMRVQLAAAKYLATSVLPGDRIGVFTSSEKIQVDFTDDREKISEAISKIIPRPIVEPHQDACPEILDSQAYLIIHQHDPFAIQIAEEEYYHCYCEQYETSDARAAQLCAERAPAEAENSAVQMMSVYETNTQAVLRNLQQTFRRLSGFPGQRTLLLVSPGFLARGFEMELDQLVDRALHANIIVNALDAKGLYAPVPGGDISKSPIFTPRHPELVGQKEQIRLDRIEQISEPLRNMSADTGGVFFHKNNDLEEGFRRIGALPEVYYVLGFSPSNLKVDGRFHAIKVNVLRPGGLSVQSRRGYFAPSAAADPAARAKQEIEEAVFSQDELRELPVDVHTQFFRVDGSSAKLSVLTHVDLRLMRFRKQEGRNLNNLTMVTVLFDNNGQYVTSQQRTVEMRLCDATLTRFGQTGITLKAVFDVKPGTYLIREVVRDTEGAQLSGLNRTVEIPY
jgi:VWFA-related protein